MDRRFRFPEMAALSYLLPQALRVQRELPFREIDGLMRQSPQACFG
jgi:hypothetical protein